MPFDSGVLYASPDGAMRVIDGAPRETLRLDAALRMVRPGQTVRLLPGVYTEPVEIENKGGSFEEPIVIRGESGVTLDGRRNLVRPTDGESVDRRSYAFIKILDSQGIVIENLTIQNVWPTAVYIGDSSEIVLRRLNLHGGDATFDNDYCTHLQYGLMARLSGRKPAPDCDKPPKFKDREGYEFAPGKGSPLLGKGMRRTIDLPDGAGDWTIPAMLNLGAFGENDSPHTLDKLGCPANGGKPGPEWATPRAGSLVFPPELEFVAIP